MNTDEIEVMQAQAFVGQSVDIAPLYALGFRAKDTK